MGLLDLTPDQADDLMNLGMGLLAAGGPSDRPVSFGQALASGYGQMLAGERNRLEGAATRQGMDMRRQAMGMQQMQLDAIRRQMATKEALGRALARQGGGAGGASLPGEAPAGLSPSSAAAFGAPEMATPDMPAQAAPRQSPSMADQLLAAAREAGDYDAFQEAMKLKMEEKKLAPKWATEFRTVMGQDGKPTLVQAADDGTVRPVTGGYGPAEKLSFHNTGAQTVGLDPYTGQARSALQNTLSPEAAASNALGWANNRLSAERLGFDRGQAALPKFNAEAGGFVMPPSAQAPSGAVIPLPGFSKPMTEAQSKDALFGSRAARSHEILSSLERGGVTDPGVIKQTLGRIPLVGGALASVANADPTGLVAPNPLQQQTEQARRDFINAVLRKESGAVISPEEFTNAERQYFPQVGDAPAVIEQKRKNRDLAIQGITLGAGSGAGQVARAQAQGRSEGAAIKTPSRQFSLDDGSKVLGQLGADGNYYVMKNGRRYRVEE